MYFSLFVLFTGNASFTCFVFLCFVYPTVYYIFLKFTLALVISYSIVFLFIKHSAGFIGVRFYRFHSTRGVSFNYTTIYLIYKQRNENNFCLLKRLDKIHRIDKKKISLDFIQSEKLHSKNKQRAFLSKILRKFYNFHL